MTAGESFLKQKASFKKSRKSVKNKIKKVIIYLLLYIMIDCSGSFYLKKSGLNFIKKMKKNTNKMVNIYRVYIWSFRVLPFKEVCFQKVQKITQKYK